MAKKWVNKVIEINRPSDTITAIKILVQAIIISQSWIIMMECGLDDSQKDNFPVSRINAIRSLGEKEIVVIAGDFNDHVRSNAEDWQPALS